ncbi:hypothetical protein SMB34_14150 [Thalassospira permensis NBRC 106175]|uniref:Uncharacterized protein n=1 Tax=Thalassospira permensis NBRC 106175 TaxID=1353532 RepID=A0ABR4TRZ4_9PROT|nr:hypothetical protein SMB34_14150 [Thalassospira permensis NBRC 106175]
MQDTATIGILRGNLASGALLPMRCLIIGVAVSF